MNQGTEWGLLMKKNRSQKSRASVPLNLLKVTATSVGFLRKLNFDWLLLTIFQRASWGHLAGQPRLHVPIPTRMSAGPT